MKYVVLMELFNENKELISSKVINKNEWYDGDIEEIDNDLYREKTNSIKATMYGGSEQVDSINFTYYNLQGKLIKYEKYDKDYNLLKSDDIV